MTQRQLKGPFRCSDELPATIPVFPLLGAILLPRGVLPINVFEPRYLALVDDVLAGNRVFGLVQPEPGTASAGQSLGHDNNNTPGAGSTSEDDTLNPELRRNNLVESPPGKQVPLHRIGCLGRLTAFSESDDRHVLVSLTGICRFTIVAEQETDLPYRICAVDYSAFSQDCEQGYGENLVDREKLLGVLKTYLTIHGLSADWESIHAASTEHLVNSLSMISPYGAEEKQALLEAPDLTQRAEILIALAEMEIAQKEHGNPGSTLQ